jgi:hypothetical protein
MIGSLPRCSPEAIGRRMPMRTKPTGPGRASADPAAADPAPLPQGSGPAAPDPDAFDLWLRSSLRHAYDNVAAEPIPENLLRLLGQHRGEGPA